jgi:hypothetical protein
MYQISVKIQNRYVPILKPSVKIMLIQDIADKNTFASKL